MAQQGESSVRLLEKCPVSLPPGFITPEPSVPLTFFDLLWLPFSPVERVFFYSYNATNTHFMNATLPNIKKSLSLTLQHFYPLAGILTWPLESTKPHVCCSKNNSGVMLTVAESNLDFDNLVGYHPRDANHFFPLVPQLTSPNTQVHDQVPVMSLQITLFPNTGICIGISTLHVIGDGKATNHFMKTWAKICKSALGDTSCLLPESLPCYNRNLISDPYNLETTYLKDIATHFNITQQCYYRPNSPKVETDKARATFELSRHDVQKIKRLVLGWYNEKCVKDTVNKKQLHLSTFVLTCAYVWVCLVKVLASDQKNTKLETEHLCFSVDCRERLIPPIPMEYFGNCLTACLVDIKKNDMIGKDGISFAAEAIANAIQKMMSQGVLVGGENLMTALKDLFSKGRFLSIAGSPKLGVYDTDFGWGRPKKVEVVSIDTSTGAGAISLSESRDGDGGLEVGLVLTKLQMDAFASLFTNTLTSLP